MLPELLFFSSVFPGREYGIKDILCIGVGNALCIGFILRR